MLATLLEMSLAGTENNSKHGVARLRALMRMAPAMLKDVHALMFTSGNVLIY